MERNGWKLCLAAFATMAFATVTQAQDALPKNLEEAGGMEALVAKAKEEGGLLLYGAPSQEKMAKWTEIFQNKYGIPVQYYRAPTNQVYQRFTQEQQVGRNQADLIAISDMNVLHDAIGKDYITDYTPANADKFSKDLVLAGHAYPLYITVQAVGWNTRVVPQDLQEKLQKEPLEALLDPRLKGHIASVTVTAGGPQIASNANLVFNLADEYGWDYLEKLATQDPAVLNPTTTMLDAVIAGDYWASADANPSVFAPQIVDGAPLAFAAPKVASATAFMLAAANNAQHPYAARLFQEWATSKEAQEELAVIAEAEVTYDGWTDRRKIVEQPWYAPAKELWFGAPNEEGVKGDNLKAFYARWNEIFKR